jgi:hypothetical protein
MKFSKKAIVVEVEIQGTFRKEIGELKANM